MVQLFYQVALTGKRDLPLAPDPRAGMEMTLLRMLNFAPIGSAADQVPPATGATPAKKPDLTLAGRQSLQTDVAPVANETQPSSGLGSPVVAPNGPVADEPLSGHGNAAPTDQARSSDLGAFQEQSAPENIQPASQKSSPDPSPIEAMQARAQEAKAQSPAPVQAIEPPPWNPEPTGEVEYIESGNTAPIMNSRLEVVAPVIPAPAEAPPAPIIKPPVANEAPKQAVAAKVEEPVSASSQEKIKEKAELLGMTLSPASWPLMFGALPVEGMLRNLVANTCLMQIQGDNLLFHSDAGHMRLFGDNHQQKFNQILNQTLSASYKIQVVEGPWQYETPAQRIQRLVAERQQQAIYSIENDSNVQALRQEFAAQVIMDSITPIDA